MRTFLFGLGLLCLSFASSAQQVAKGLTAANGTFIGFYEYKPTNYTTSKKYPLIIFLHGIGERGNGTTELPWVLNNAIPRYISQGNTMTFTNSGNGKQETFLVLSPQLSKSYGYWDPFYVEELIKYASTNLSIDPNRIYLTGLSLGGGGTWRYATNSNTNAARLAAIAPVCGTGETIDVCNLTKNNVGVWAFHAMDDGTVGVGNTQNSEIKIGWCQPGYPAKFTYYPTGGHAIWDKAYSTDHSIQNPNVYEWMLSQSKTGNTLYNQAPFSDAGADQVIILPANTVTLNGSASKDPDGTIAKYAWAQISGPSTSTIANPAVATTTTTNLVQGTYVFRLTVTDTAGSTGTDDIQVIVKAPGNTGYIGALPYPWSEPGESTTMNTQLWWNGTLGDGTVLYTNAIMTAKYNGNLVNILFANNSGFQTSIARFRTGSTGMVEGYKPAPALGNQVPVSNAGIDQTITLPANSVTVNGSASKDNDGIITGYAWAQVSGPTQYSIVNPSSSSTAINNLAQGTYIFRLTVTDNGGATNSDDVQISVSGLPGTSTTGYIGAMPYPWSEPGESTTMTKQLWWTGTLGDGTVVYTNAAMTAKYDGGLSNILFANNSGFQASVARFRTGSSGMVEGYKSSTINTAPAPPVNTNANTGYIGNMPYPWSEPGESTNMTTQVWWTGTLGNGAVVYTNAAMTTKYDGALNNILFANNSGYQPSLSRFRTGSSGVVEAYKLAPTTQVRITNTATDQTTISIDSATVNKGTINTADKTAQAATISAKALNSLPGSRANAIGVSNIVSKIYPNPASSYVMLQLAAVETGLLKITIYSQLGKAVKTFSTVKSGSVLQQKIDVSNLSHGFYFIEVITAESKGKPVVFKFEKL